MLRRTVNGTVYDLKKLSTSYWTAAITSVSLRLFITAHLELEKLSARVDGQRLQQGAIHVYDDNSLSWHNFSANKREFRFDKHNNTHFIVQAHVYGTNNSKEIIFYGFCEDQFDQHELNRSLVQG